MPTPAATVSLYIPCRNAENHIERTLESVFPQTYPLCQVIVVDDGSTDQTLRVLNSYPVQVVQHPEAMGITETRNTALKNVRGEFVAAVDGDVVLEADWLERIMANFSQRSIGGVGGRIIETNTESLAGQWIIAHRNPDGGQEKKNPSCLPTTAVVYRRQALLEIGGFNDDKRYDHSDLDASMRVVMIGYRLGYEPKAICHHHFQGDVRSLFDGMWRFRKDAYVNCGLFTNPFGLRRKIEINLGQCHQMLMDDFNARRHAIMHLNIIGALRHSLMDIRLYCRRHPENGKGSDVDTFMALKQGFRYLLSQKESISRSLSADIMAHVSDICMDSEIENSSPEFPENAGDRDLLFYIKDRFPRADLDRVSDWLIMFLGFLESFPCEIWENMNRLATESRNIQE